MYKLIVLLPLVGALLAMPTGRMFSARAAELLTSGLMILVAVFSWTAFFSVTGSQADLTVPLFTWINSGDFHVAWALKIDSLTAVMLVVVNTVSCLVHIYSIGYMSHDPHRPRFFAYLSLFTFAMLSLVTASNFLQMFFGWEGVGLASYLLIGFWFHKDSANAAAIKAFVVNRVGDFGFVLGIMATFMVFGSIEFDKVFPQVHHFENHTFHFLAWEVPTMTTICLLLFVGAMGKSAQIVLHTWLPDAMEGPTPVSALIHAATMVTAGVFMICRLSYMFEAAPTALAVVTVVGATTAFFAATVGLFQNDIKRVIAYSTCSQLGYMFFAAGVSAYPVAMFHLFTHAFFKALLFLGAGSVIHAMSDEQDMRKMGGIYKMIPMTWAMMLIGTFALTGVGIPGVEIFGAPLGFAGFVSKDGILEMAYAAHSGVGKYAFWMGIAAAVMTSFYSWRLAFMTFHDKPRASTEVMSHVHESPAVMTIPLAILAVGAVLAGMVFYGGFMGHDLAAFWGASFPEHGATHAVMTEAHHVKQTVAVVVWAPFVVMLLGLGIAYYYYIRHPELPPKMGQSRNGLYLFVKNKWYFDELYDFLFVRPAQKIGRFFWKKGDGLTIDGFGPDGVSALVLKITGQVVRLQTGYLYHYAFAMLIGVAALVTYFMFFGGAN
ncbi:MAG: NADH-quinone oxidoreductase subunit L [Alphaproteobacteria bacterium]|nr:MAG: NADH-quinone oxidoreductase subunit L [Alphaproteobacteria bacterium]